MTVADEIVKLVAEHDRLRRLASELLGTLRLPANREAFAQEGGPERLWKLVDFFAPKILELTGDRIEPSPVAHWLPDTPEPWDCELRWVGQTFEYSVRWTGSLDNPKNLDLRQRLLIPGGAKPWTPITEGKLVFSPAVAQDVSSTRTYVPTGETVITFEVLPLLKITGKAAGSDVNVWDRP